MTDRLRALLPALVVALIGVATVVGLRVDGPAVTTSDTSHAAALHATLAELARPRVLVGFDPDLGTYAEIRPAARAALAQLVRGGASLAFASFTAEGRALSLAEMDRLRRGGVEEGRVLDLRFHAGAEAGLVRSVSDILPDGAAGALADALRDDGGGIGAFDLVLVVGGTELGPRSWVEQVATRLPELRLAAIVPTVLQPEAIPYRVTGQLDGLVAGVREASAYVAAVRDDPTAVVAREAERVSDLPPSWLPLVVGIGIMIVLLADAVASRWRDGSPVAR